MRQLVLQVLSEQKNAISLPDLERKFEKADKATLYRTLDHLPFLVFKIQQKA